jgi:uncharacterized protein involved in cysteine biosynthesis
VDRNLSYHLAELIVYGTAFIVLWLVSFIPTVDGQSVALILVYIVVATLMVVHSHLQRRRKHHQH